MKNERVNIGIIGAGWIVEHAHIPALLEIKEACVMAIYDIDAERVRRLCLKFNVQNACEKIEDFYSLDIDGVIIATPNYTHAEYSLKMLRHGIHVLCEKPVALHAREVMEIIELEKENNVLYIPGFVNRWRMDIQKIYNYINSGVIGEIKNIDAGWLRKCGVPRPGTWFTNRTLAGGGVLVDLGSHVLDIGLMLMGDKKSTGFELQTSLYDGKKMDNSSAADWFKADSSGDLVSDVEYASYAAIQYSDGSRLEVKLSWLTPIDGDCTYLNIIGSKGKIKLQTLFGFSNERLWTDDTLQVEHNGIKETEKLDRRYNSTKNAFQEMLRYYISAITKQTTISTNSKDALRTVDTIERLYHVECPNLDAVNCMKVEGSM